MQVRVDTSDRLVLTALLEGEPLTRPELADRTGLSKPTVSEAVRRLEQTALVSEAGVRRGRPGRVPTYYTLAPVAGFVVAVDIGGDNLRVTAADLTGEQHVERRQASRGSGAGPVIGQAVEMIQAALDETGDQYGPLRQLVVSAPGVVHADGRTVSTAYNIGEDGPFDLVGPIERATGVPVVVDNNVNMAAVGERWRGLGREVPTFAFVAVGAGIGMGLVYDGELVRGAHGAAGEVAYLPLPDAPPAAERYGRGREQLVAEAGGYRMLDGVRRAGAWSGPRPDTVEQLFAQAAAGVAEARELVEDEGRQIGLTVASACAVFDPELVVLGGGIGSNPLLLPLVRNTVESLVPFPPHVEISSLGDVASLTGALAVALRLARHELLASLVDGA
jgi:predicted NBD/HSP70 family sugar kinase/biotin operon repressor